jgi:hypothetical protein
MPRYKRFSHKERPFVLHLFVDYAPNDIATKMNKVKSGIRVKGIVFDADHFEIDQNEEACTFEVDEVLPGHYCLVLRKPPVKVGTIAHELIHVISRHFRYIGTPLTIDTEESYAYMMSWLMDEVSRYCEL